MRRLQWFQPCEALIPKRNIGIVLGSTYMVKARDGAEHDDPQIDGVVKASLSDIKQGSFVQTSKPHYIAKAEAHTGGNLRQASALSTQRRRQKVPVA